MPVEIERKFLVRSDEWRTQIASTTIIRQGYLTQGGGTSVRVRLTDRGAWLAVKSGGTPLGRLEFEYPIPVKDAETLLELCAKPILEKVRHVVSAGTNLFWEVDEFGGELSGIIMAEVELPTAKTPLLIPRWVGTEVTLDPRYLNSNIHSLADPSLRAPQN